MAAPKPLFESYEAMKPIHQDDAKSHLSAAEIFRVPLWIALCSFVGLISALIGDGVWDVVSWLTLSLPFAVLWWCFSKR